MRQFQSAADRAYEEIKRRAIVGGLGAGRIDLQRLAAALRMSQTPLREALARLATERLIQASPGFGYAVIVPNARQLRQLYKWNGELAELALGQISEKESAPDATLLEAKPSFATYPERISAFFRNIAASQQNPELSAQAEITSDRLFQARIMEPSLIDDALEDLAHLETAWRARDYTSLREALLLHHQARAQAAPNLAEAIAARAEDLRTAWP